MPRKIKNFVPSTPITNKVGSYFEPKEIPLDDEPGMFQSLNLGSQQGLTLNHADEAKNALYQYLMKKKGLPEDPAYLDQVRGEYKKAQEKNPWSYGIGQVGGAILPWLTGAGEAAAALSLPEATAVSLGMGALNRTGEQEVPVEEKSVTKAVTEHPIATAFDLALPGVGQSVLKKFGSSTKGAAKAASKTQKASEKATQEFEDVALPALSGSKTIADDLRNLTNPDIETMAIQGIGRAKEDLAEESLKGIKNKQGTGLLDEAGQDVGFGKLEALELEPFQIPNSSETLDKLTGNISKYSTGENRPWSQSVLNKIQTWKRVLEGKVRPEDASKIASDIQNELDFGATTPNFPIEIDRGLKEVQNQIKTKLHEMVPGYGESDQAYSSLMGGLNKKIKIGEAAQGSEIDKARNYIFNLLDPKNTAEKELFLKTMGDEGQRILEEAKKIGLADRVNKGADRLQNQGGFNTVKSKIYDHLMKKYKNRSSVAGTILGSAGMSPLGGEAGAGGAIGGFYLGKALPGLFSNQIESSATKQAQKLFTPENLIQMAKKVGATQEEAQFAAQAYAQAQQMAQEKGVEAAKQWFYSLPIANSIQGLFNQEE